jgi:hypothetical protein
MLAPPFLKRIRIGTVLFPPLGLVLLWRHRDLKLGRKLLGTAGALLYSILYVALVVLVRTIEQRHDREAVTAYEVATGRELWAHNYPELFSESMGGAWCWKIALAIGGLMPVNFRVRVFAEARPAPFVLMCGMQACLPVACNK